MLEHINRLPSRAVNAFRTVTTLYGAGEALAALERSLHQEWHDNIGRVTGAPRLDLNSNEELQAAVENLTDAHTTVRLLRTSPIPVCPEKAAAVIAQRIMATKRLVTSGMLTGDAANNVALKTLNLLFAGEQELRCKFLLAPRMEAHEPPRTPKTLTTDSEGPPFVMELPSAKMFQLRESLFPAERMIVGAGRRAGTTISIEAMFDVTGAASTAGVKADPDKLGRALISMSQSGTYFALWVHSHPGSGPRATQPSQIDLRQYADWLRNYSETLVSAIMVADRYFRFWGSAVENRNVKVSFTGDGVSVVSEADRIYKLEV